MIKIYLYCYEYNLGYLFERDNKYIWNPNIENINSAKEKYPISMDIFSLKTAETIYDNIPEHFSLFETASERADLILKANILQGDTIFIKLYKLAKLIYENQEFVIKTK